MTFNRMETKLTYHTYLDNIMSRFIAGLGDYMRSQMFPRTQDIIISSYSKAVEYIINRKRRSGENWSPSYPFIVIDPQMDFSPDNVAGRSFANYPGFLNHFQSNLYKPYIYKDDNVEISAVLNRYVGTMDITVWCSSVYESMDVRFFLLQYFGGLNRPIYPDVIEGYILIDDEITYYDYDNPYKEQHYRLDWESYSQNAEITLVRNINTNMMSYPIKMRPYIKLTNISDGNDKFDGGADALGDHRVNFTIEWDASIPTHLITTIYRFPVPCKELILEISLDNFRFINIGDGKKGIIPEEKLVISHPTILTDREQPGFSKDTYDLKFENYSLIYWKTSSYNITDEDYDKLKNEENVLIELPYPVDSCVMLTLFTKNGQLERDFDWKLQDDKHVLIWGIGVKNKIEIADIITIAYYVEELPSVLYNVQRKKI